MFFAVLSIGFLAPTCEETKAVTSAEKRAFLQLLKALPHKGEFFTAEAIKKAAPHIRVLLALTQKDIEKYDIYPFLALSRGLLAGEKEREYGVKHFADIAHPEIKLCWGVDLFNEKDASPEIIRYLRRALKSKEQAKLLSEMMGRKSFDDFKKRLAEYPLKQK